MIIHLLLFIIAIATGYAVNRFIKQKQTQFPIKHFEIHEEAHEKIQFNIKYISEQLKEITLTRLILIITFLAAIVLVALNFNNILEGFGSMGHSHNSQQHLHPEWISITFIVVLAASLFIVLMASTHFLDEHLWNHIVKKHIVRILSWTFLTLLAIHFASQYVDVENLIGNNLYVVLIIAVIVGIIPESGPHLIFIILFASGNLPFSILLANSIVQDGHGSLPLLAESQKNFIIIKAINVAVGLIIGLTGILAGF